MPTRGSSQTEASIRAQLADLRLGPIRLQAAEPEARLAADRRPDVLVSARWGDSEQLYACAIKARSTPRVVDAAVAQAQRAARQADLLPLVVVPYLGEERLASLEREGVSGIDLCGNGVVIGPGLRVWRSGQPNRYKDSAPIRNVFGGVSSLIGRCFLLCPEFASMTALRAFAIERMASGKLSLGTVSKVVRVLDEQVLVQRQQDGLRLVDPEGLRQRLLRGYRARPTLRLEGRTDLGIDEAWRRLATTAADAAALRCTATGIGSVGRYGVLSAPAKISLYVSDLAAVRDLLEVQETRLFPNVELIEDGSEVVHFDRRVEGDVAWASPIQAWVELMEAGPREREAADELLSLVGGSDKATA
jgi:hypothetical protein